MIPSRALGLLAVLPVVLALLALADASLVWPMLATDLAIALVAAIDALLTLRAQVEVVRQAPTVMSVGRPNVVVLNVRSSSRRRLSISVVDDLFEGAESDDLPLVVELPARGRASARYRVTPTRRGGFSLGTHHVRYPSPLGLWQRQLKLAADTPVRVYPDVQAVRAYELLARQDREASMFRSAKRRGGESEFERLRDYRRGDEYRSLDWRATARKGKLIAREYQVESNQSIVFALDAGRLMTAESSGLALFDHALNAAVMLSHVATRGGDQVGLVAFSDRMLRFAPPKGGARAARRVVQAVYDLHADLVATSYAAAFDHVGLHLKKRSLVIVFTQVADEVSAADLLRLARGLSPRHLPLFVVFRDEDVFAQAEGARVDPYQRSAAAEILAARDRLLRELGRGGALVVDVATSGITPQLINRYLEIKARHLL